MLFACDFTMVGWRLCQTSCLGRRANEPSSRPAGRPADNQTNQTFALSLHRALGDGFGPKLNLIVFQVSPGRACNPRLAVGSYPQWTMQFSQRLSRATPL